MLLLGAFIQIAAPLVLSLPCLGTAVLGCVGELSGLHDLIKRRPMSILASRLESETFRIIRFKLPNWLNIHVKLSRGAM